MDLRSPFLVLEPKIQALGARNATGFGLRIVTLLVLASSVLASIAAGTAADLPRASGPLLPPGCCEMLRSDGETIVGLRTRDAWTELVRVDPATGASSVLVEALDGCWRCAWVGDELWMLSVSRYDPSADSSLPPRDYRVSLLDGTVREAPSGGDGFGATGTLVAHAGTLYSMGALSEDGLSRGVARFDEAAKVWRWTNATFPPLLNADAWASDGVALYSFGGSSVYATPGGVDWVMRFDPVTETLDRLSHGLPSARHSVSVEWTGTSFVIAGGVDANGTVEEIVVLDPENGPARVAGLLPDGATIHALLSVAGRLLAIESAGTVGARMFELDEARQPRVLGEPYPTAMPGTVVTTAHGRAFAIPHEGPEHRVAAFDLSARTVEMLEARVPEGLVALQAASDGERAVLFGGRILHAGPEWTDEEANRVVWEIASSGEPRVVTRELPFERDPYKRVPAAVLGNRLIAFGHTSDRPVSWTIDLDTGEARTVDLIAPAERRWALSDSFTNAWATTAGDEIVLFGLPGGYVGRYDPITGELRSTRNAWAPSLHASAVASDGARAWVVGTMDGSPYRADRGPFASVLRYDPARDELEALPFEVELNGDRMSAAWIDGVLVLAGYRDGHLEVLDPDAPGSGTFGWTALRSGVVTVNASTLLDAPDPRASYTWNWGDGSVTRGGPVESHNYSSSARYPVEVIVESRGETRAAARNVTLSRNEAPRVELEPGRVRDRELHLYGNVRDDEDEREGRAPDGLIDWGDGTQTTLDERSHAYAELGEYRVTVRARDAEGAESAATFEVTVRDDPPFSELPAPGLALALGALSAAAFARRRRAHEG